MLSNLNKLNNIILEYAVKKKLLKKTPNAAILD